MDDLPPLFAPGQRLGRYELLQRLAVGGMAEVYLAYASGPGDFRKVVAIKRMLPQHALDPQLLKMFLDEARLMARLSHPNVPQVTDVDDGEVPYFVMEYIHGTDLRGILNAAGGALPIEIALTIGTAIAAGLHHAHEQRGVGGQPLEIVHRDVSPSNVLVSFDGGVKVTDFGVAKWAEQKSFTHQGQLKGKFAHMSPEQCRGEPLDRRSDVFALGTLIYEMTTGAPPFVAESEYELLTQIVQRDAPPPVRPGEEYPAGLRDIVMRSLHRVRGDRQASAQDLQLQLEAFAREHRLVVSPVALAEYLETLFGARVTEWREALKSGQTLVDLLEKRAGRTVTGADGGAGGAGARLAPGGDRTATDVFTLGQAEPPAGNTANPANGSTATAARGKRGTRAVGRNVAIGVVAAGALALLLVATEATSRWQRGARGPSGPALPSPVGLPAAGPARHTDAAQLGTRAGEGAGAVPPGANTPANTSPAPADGSPAATATMTRRGRDAAAPTRGTRREPVAGARRMTTTTTTTTASADAAPALERGPSPGGEPAAAGGERAGIPAPTTVPTPSPPPTGPRATTPSAPAAPVKVWDPDSPLPP